MKSNKSNIMMVSPTPVRRHKSNNLHNEGDQQKPSQSLLHHHHRSMLSLMLFLLFLTSCTAGVNAQRRDESRTYPLLSAIPETKFRCFERAAGYYADVETGCQVYHMCDTLEKQYSYLCPNYTLFNQKFMICDHWYMVNCTMSDTFFDLNDHIGTVPTKRSNTIIGGNNQGTRKSTILAQIPNGLQSFKTIIPGSQNKIQGTTKTTQIPTRRPTQSSLFTLPKRPLTTKSPTKITNSRPPTTKTTKIFESTSKCPSKFIFSRPPFSTTSDDSGLVTTVKPSRVSVISNTLKTTPHPNRASPSTFTTRRFVSNTTRPVNQISNSVFTKQSSGQTSTSKPTIVFSTTQTSFKSSVFNQNTLTTTTSPVTTKSSLLNRNTPTSTTKKPFIVRFPGNAARSPGGSFSFSKMKIHNITITNQQLDRMTFKPDISNSFTLQSRPPSSSFPFRSTGKPLKSILKAHPLVTTPHSMESDEEGDQTSQHSTQHILAAPLRALSLPSQSFSVPSPSRLLIPPHFSGISTNETLPISNDIEPPTARRKGTSPIKLSRKNIMNPQVVRAEVRQESPFTPFMMKPAKFSSFGISEETVSGDLHVSFHSARGNRNFFIPSSGLTLPEDTLKTPSNSLNDNLDDHDHKDNSEHPKHGSHMTMLFPGSTGTPVISALALNPKCPHCHPSFLRPGHCEPCVRIRR